MLLPNCTAVTATVQTTLNILHTRNILYWPKWSTECKSIQPEQSDDTADDCVSADTKPLQAQQSNIVINSAPICYLTSISNETSHQQQHYTTQLARFNVLQMRLSQPASISFTLHLFCYRTSDKKWHKFSMGRMYFPAARVRAVNGTRSIDANQAQRCCIQQWTRDGRCHIDAG